MEALNHEDDALAPERECSRMKVAAPLALDLATLMVITKDTRNLQNEIQRTPQCVH